MSKKPLTTKDPSIADGQQPISNVSVNNNGKEIQEAPIPTNTILPKYVVGVGASAGGLEALEVLFSHMPIKMDMAYIIVQHLSPDYKSMMAELLARKTMIPIKVAQDQMIVESDTIYLLPPKKEMIVANHRLYLTEREHTDMVNLPINTFFRSMAESYEEKSIAIVLSGTGSDGSIGAAKVHDSGGFVIAQSPESCKFDSMPQSVINTNKVDLVYNPEIIPDALIKYSKRTENVEKQLDLGALDAEVSEFSEILILLNNRFDLDFSQYKPSTITRRLERRVACQNSNSLKDYINILLSNKDELEALYYDLLIGVTHFFRDGMAFKSLMTLIPTLLKKFKDEPEIRIWVSACASGQEAYSLAIVMAEFMESDPHGHKPFKIFATDIHNLSIQTAAAGIYHSEDLRNIDERYKANYFTKLDEERYQIVPRIRKSIVFAQHNLLKDPPFTRTHLVSCRNLLIYFNATAQQRVLSLLSFSLMNQGLLFIGPSEAIGSHSSDFEMIDSIHRIFRKTRTTTRPNDLPIVMRNKPPTMDVSGNELTSHSPASMKSRKALEVLLQKYVPASILIDEKGNVLHVFGNVGKYLSLHFGSISLNVTALVTGEAKMVIGQMLHRIGKNYQSIKTKNVKGFNADIALDIEMSVLSEMPNDLNYIIISLAETSVDKSKGNAPPVLLNPDNLENLTPYAEDRIKELEDQLMYAQETLQTTVEELETSNEELQASNEELMASNEELQSTNEELQSVNEELFTVNHEFQQKEIERVELRSDERSIIDELGLAIMFIDENLKIRKASPAIEKIFQIDDSDFGRTFSSIAGTITQEIQEDVYSVFYGSELIEKEVADQDGLIYLARINAYTPSSDEIDNNSSTNKNKGVVITLTNITNLHTIQKSLLKSQNLFNDTLNAISDGYFEWVLETNDIFFSPTFYKLLGFEHERPSIEQLLGKSFTTFTSTVTEKSQKPGNQKVEEILSFNSASGEPFWVILKAQILIDEKRKQTKLIGIVIDFNPQKQVEYQLKEQAIALARSNNLLEKFAYIVSHDLKAPIRHILNYLMFLKEAVKKKDEQGVQQEILGIEKSAENLTELVDDVITYARVTSEKNQMIDVDVNAIIKYVLELLAPIITKKKIAIKTDDMPIIKGDKSLLTHLFQNLISNACKYSDKKNSKINITYALEDEQHVICVTDNGIGFNENNAEKIFEPFKRLVTKDQYEGNGIGLSICRIVTDLHKGSIKAESTKNEGATFTVKLPISRETNDD